MNSRISSGCLQFIIRLCLDGEALLKTMVVFHVNILKVSIKRAKIEIVSCTTYESHGVCDQYLHKGLKLPAREKTINSINQITNIVHAASDG